MPIDTRKPGEVLPRGSASGAPQIKRTPSCKRCGTDVGMGQDFCETCGEIVAQKKPPQATVIIIREVEKKPEPEEGDA